MAKNTLLGLNDILFEQLERLNKPDLQGDQLDTEIKRSGEINRIAKNIISNANVVLRAQIAKDDRMCANTQLPELLGGQQNEQKPAKR